MNRMDRRKQIKIVANDILKGRTQAVKKKQYGLGLVVTNLMIVVMFGPWTWTLRDQRLA